LGNSGFVVAVCAGMDCLLLEDLLVFVVIRFLRMYFWRGALLGFEGCILVEILVGFDVNRVF
jgi:hypothetical protein